MILILMNSNFPILCGFNECSEAGKDHFVPVIFLSRCNLRCPYCMNSDLIFPHFSSKISIDEIHNKVKNLGSEMVLISGGEPTCTELTQLKSLIDEIWSWGVKVGMATNGTNHNAIQYLIPYLSFVVMDLKVVYEVAPQYLDSLFDPMTEMIRSKTILTQEKRLRENFDYELRTTLYPPYVKKKDIRNIGGIIRQDERWILQQFRITPNMLDKNSQLIKPYSPAKLNGLLAKAKEYTQFAELRWV